MSETNENLETLEHQETLDDLIQVGDAFMQDIDSGIQIRIDELLKENNIDEDDIEEVYSGVTVSITIIYKKKGTENDEN
jgi:hypothetical protein